MAYFFAWLPPFPVMESIEKRQYFIPDYIDLWWANWWDEKPILAKSCSHTGKEFSRDSRWTEHIVWCDECWFYYNYNSSD